MARKNRVSKAEIKRKQKCKWKIGHEGRAYAEVALVDTCRVLEGQGKGEEAERLQVYLCEYCEKWHIGRCREWQLLDHPPGTMTPIGTRPKE